MTYYRYEDRLIENGISIACIEYQLLKKTQRGAWIELYGHKRFVLDNARKHFACPSKEEALKSFQARKIRQIRILTRNLRLAQTALSKSLEPDPEGRVYLLGDI